MSACTIKALAIVFGSVLWIAIGIWMAPHSLMLAYICCIFGPIGSAVAVATDGVYRERSLFD